MPAMPQQTRRETPRGNTKGIAAMNINEIRMIRDNAGQKIIARVTCEVNKKIHEFDITRDYVETLVSTKRHIRQLHVFADLFETIVDQILIKANQQQTNQKGE